MSDNPIEDLDLDLIGDLLVGKFQKQFDSKEVGIFISVLAPDGKVESTTNMSDETVNGFVGWLYAQHIDGAYTTEEATRTKQ